MGLRPRDSIRQNRLKTSRIGEAALGFFLDFTAFFVYK